MDYKCGKEHGVIVSISTLGKAKALLGHRSDVIKTTVDKKEIFYIQICRNYGFGCFSLRRMHSKCHIPQCSACLQLCAGLRVLINLWNRLPREAVKSPSMEVFRKGADIALHDIV